VPDSSSRRSLSQPLWRSLRVALAAVLMGVVIFVGLTRTQVGRDTIRQQVEAAFNQRYAGQLSIGSLSGTLIDDVVATNVQLRAPSGTVIASVDSVRGTPRWANLLTAELSVRTLRLIRPHLSLRRDSTGTWNVARALRQNTSPSPSAQPLDLSFADIEVQNGRVTTAREGPAPEAVQHHWVFDYTRTQVTDIFLTASARRAGSSSLFDISNASFALPGLSSETSSLQGQLRRTEAGWTLQDFDLSFGATHIRGRATLQNDRSDAEPTAFTLEMDRSRLDNDQLRRFVPRLPLAETMTIRGTLKGTPNRLRANDVTVTHNASFATVEGTITRTSEALILDLRLPKSHLVPKDVRSTWPGLPTLPSPKIGPIDVNGTLQGTTAQAGGTQRTFDLDARVRARTPHGTVQGSLAVARPRTSPLTYRTALNADSLNLAPLTGRPSLSSRLNGRVEVQGRGTQIDALQGQMDLSLAASRIAGRSLASADGQLKISDDSAEGKLTVRQGEGGRLFLKGTAERLGTRPEYTIAASSSDLNLTSLGENLPSTALNARLSVRASGTGWRPLTGTAVVNVDSSHVYRGDSTITVPPHSATLHLADRNADRPRLQVSGSVATLTADGTSLGPSLWTTARTWGRAFRDAVRRIRHKPAPAKVRASSRIPLPPASSSEPPPLRKERQAALVQGQTSGPLAVQAEVRVHQSKILNAWWPLFPRDTEAVAAEATLTAGADTLHATGHVTAAHLQSGSKEIDDLEVRYEVSSRFRAPLAQSTTVTAEVSAGRMAIGGPPLMNASASLSYGARSGTLRVRADSVGIAESLRLTSDLRITPTTNELRVGRVAVDVNGDTWTNPAPASVFAYSDKLVVTPFVLRKPHPQTPSLQRVRVGGTISAAATDTLSVDASNVYLPPLSELTGLSQVLGGNLNARLRLRSGWGRPRLVGDLSVRRLSFDQRLLGDAQLRVRYSAQSSDLLVDGSLGTDVSNADSLVGPSLVPGGIRTVDPNSLSLSGRVRLPEWARARSPKRPSAVPSGEVLDLSVQVTRADLFFFRYIFEEHVSAVEGHVTGPLHIGGQPRRPIFDADFTIENGGVTLPLFGLEYEVEGPVDVDRTGIHPRGLTIRDDEGTAAVDGSILFNEYKFFSFDLSASLDGLTVIDVSQAKDLAFYGHIRGSGPLHLTGPLSDATLRSNSARTTPDSELFIPVSSETPEEDSGFIVFADSTGQTPDLRSLTRRRNILADRPEGVPSFVEGLNIDLNVIAPSESTVNLVFDPLVGDVVTVVGSGRVQIQRKEGDFSVYGNFNATSGTYLFTAGEVFVRRFSINEGTIFWDGSPTNARLDLDAEYRTRASPSGLPGYENYRGRIPVTVLLDITGRVATPRVDLGLSLIRDDQRNLVGSESLDAILNQPTRTTEYATSVLLTNTFLLTTESIAQPGGTEDGDNRLTTAGNQLAFNSVSQLVSSQLNRYLGRALPNVDLNFGVQGENPDDLDLIYGVALRLLNERLVIRGEGLYTGDDPDANRAEGPQGEVVVEVRLSSSVSAKVFYRRTGDELTQNRSLTRSRGVGVSYQTQYPTWKSLFDRLFGWMFSSDPAPEDEDETDSEPVVQSPLPPDSSSTPNNQR